jgi:hypothetical protein
MDAVINYDEVAGFLKNSPSLKPPPEFTNIRALKKHVIQVLSQLYCPQNAIHGWAGLAMDPVTYQLLEGTAFIVPIDPGLMVIYPQWVALTMVKMIDVTFLHDKNYFSSYKNITRACFRMFDTTHWGTIQSVKHTRSEGVELHHVHH